MQQGIIRLLHHLLRTRFASGFADACHVMLSQHNCALADSHHSGTLDDDHASDLIWLDGLLAISNAIGDLECALRPDVFEIPELIQGSGV